jgi:trehalose PTS system EIIBC or EIIBCA component
LNQIDLVKGSFFTGGLYQIVIGPGEVEKVYAALREQTGLAAATIADVKKKGADKTNAMQRLVRVFSDVFMPILPALIIAGLLMGVNNLLGAKGMFIEGKTLLDAYPQPGRGVEPDQPDGQHLVCVPACAGGLVGGQALWRQ